MQNKMMTSVKKRVLIWMEKRLEHFKIFTNRGLYVMLFLPKRKVEQTVSV